MPNLLEIGAQFHAAVMPHAAGVSVLYIQGEKPVALTAWPARKNTEAVGEDGFLTRIDFYEWTLIASELGMIPRRGDQIIETRNGAKITYEVLPHGNLPAWDHLGTSGLMYRVRTKLLTDI